MKVKLMLFFLQSVIESVVLFLVLISVSRFFVSAKPEPEPQNGLVQGFGQLAGSALGAAAGSFGNISIDIEFEFEKFKLFIEI